MFKDESELNEQELTYLYEKCHIWVQENFNQGDIIIALVGYDDNDNIELVHCFLYDRVEGMYIDVRGNTWDWDEFTKNFDIEDTYQFDFINLDDFQRFLTEMEETGDINPDNY